MVKINLHPNRTDQVIDTVFLVLSDRMIDEEIFFNFLFSNYVLVYE